MRLLHPGNNKGFTLLEVIVSLALIATLGIALFTWINNSLANINRTKRLFQQEQATANALAWLTMLNPSLNPEGAITLGDEKILWKSTLIAPTRPIQTPFSADKGLYQVALYSLQVKIMIEEQEIYSFSIRKAGWEQTVLQPKVRP